MADSLQYLGALSIAAGLFGAAGAVALRIGANVFGSVYTVLFDKVMNGLVQLVDSRGISEKQYKSVFYIVDKE